MRKRNLISAAILIAIGIGYAVLAVQLPTRNIENATGPSFFPLVVVTGFLILAAALLVQAMRGRANLGAVPGLAKISRRTYIWSLAAAEIILVATNRLIMIVINFVIFFMLFSFYFVRVEQILYQQSCLDYRFLRSPFQLLKTTVYQLQIILSFPLNIII